MGFHGLQPARFLCPCNNSGNHAGVRSHALLQGIFSTQGSNSGLLHCSETFPCLRNQGRAKTLQVILKVRFQNNSKKNFVSEALISINHMSCYFPLNTTLPKSLLFHLITSVYPCLQLCLFYYLFLWR